MSGVGLKRKARPQSKAEEMQIAGGEQSLTSMEAEILQFDVDEIIEKHVQGIKSGSNQDFQHRRQALEKLQNKHLAAADRNRKAQIRNIEQLYEFEVEDAKALFERSCNELQDEMISKIRQERNRLLALQQKLMRRESGNSGADTGVMGRSLRSSFGAEESSEAGSRPGKMQGKRKQQAQSSSAGRNLALDEILPESAVKEDFLEIVRDLESCYQPSVSEKVSISVGDDCSSFSVDDKTFHIGEDLSVFSLLSQESVNGIVTTVSLRDIVVRSPEGIHISFQLAQVESGRLIVSKEKDVLAQLQHTTRTTTGTI